MQMEPSKVSSEDKGAALICAPCWICLEEGPDEAGEPLVRDCACRGETSAGYHLSCIVNYAKRKTRRLEKRTFWDYVEKYGHEVRPREFWEICPNCNQEYARSIRHSLVDTMVDSTKHLPDTHWVRFRARITWVDTHASFTVPVSREKFSSIEKEIESLNKLIEEPQLALSMFGAFSAEHPVFVKGFRCVESSRLMRLLCNLYHSSRENEEALRYAEESVLKIEEGVSEGLPVAHELSSARDLLQAQKLMMGINESEDEVKVLRDRLRETTTTTDVVSDKIRLVLALTQIDPPQYVEAIKLMDDIIATYELCFGTQHDLSTSAKVVQIGTKNRYRDYLRKLKKSK